LTELDLGVVSIVDDDASIRRSLRNLVSSAGFRVETFASAEAFLESAWRHRSRCALVDLRMPGMSGLELLRTLSLTGSPPRVVILTGHGDASARRQCLAAGAVAFLQKPCDSGALLAAVAHAATGHDETYPLGLSQRPSMKGSRRTIELASGTVGEHRHICAFFNSADEEYRVLRSFIREGLDEGDKGLHIVDPDRRDDHLRRLAAEGIDVERAMATNQLEVHPWEAAYLRSDRFEQDAMLKFVEDVLQTNAAAGYARTRIVAHMEWALLDKPGVEDLLEYETRANYVLPKYDDPVICTYDLSKFSARVAMDVMRTHPSVIIGGVLQDNPYFVPPDQFLVELRERRSADRIDRATT
jgi:CheY-like chemotaxis protein